MRNYVTQVILPALVCSCAATAVAQPSFTVLPQLRPYQDQFGFGISADGGTVVGRSGYPLIVNDPRRAFVWRAGAIQGLPDLWPGNSTDEADAIAASATGQFVVGTAINGAQAWRAVRWADDAPTELPVPAGITYSGATATGISADGGVAVGFSYGNTTRALRWDGTIGIDLGGAAGMNSHRAVAVSADGQTIAGHSSPGGSAIYGTPWRWDDGVVTELPVLPAANPGATLRGISADGSTLVGECNIAVHGTRPNACLWRDGQVVNLAPDVFVASSARAVTAGGSVVVGFSQDFGAFIWDEQHGRRSIEALLRGWGVDLGTWRLTDATGISADGRTIVGHCESGNDRLTWVATIPGPSAGFLMFGAGSLAMCRRRRVA